MQKGLDKLPRVWYNINIRGTEIAEARKHQREVIKMKRKFFVINETGGYFGGWEEELCKAYCKANGYSYHTEYRNLGY